MDVRGGCIILLPPRTVLNPTELLNGLAEGIQIVEPIKEELKKAAAAKLEGNILK